MSNRNSRKRKSDPDWFKRCLYSDPEFIEIENRFRRWAHESLSEDSLTVISLLAGKDQSLKQLIIERVGSCEGTEMIETAARRFEIPEYLIEYGLIKFPAARGVDTERRPQVFTKRSLNLRSESDENPKLEIRDNEIVIKVFPNTRLKDVEAHWFIVESKQKKMQPYVPQLKTTSNPELLYAIYKQRLLNDTGKRKSFPAIFEMYKNDTLPGYKGSTHFDVSDSLAKYYRDHKPNPNIM